MARKPISSHQGAYSKEGPKLPKGKLPKGHPGPNGGPGRDTGLGERLDTAGVVKRGRSFSSVERGIVRRFTGK
jgi:hypothetical protein